MELMATKAKRDRLKRMQTREPYKYTRKIVLKLSKSDKRSREREVLKKMSQTYTAHEIITYQKWYEWREKARKLLPLKAEYFNQCLRRYRNKALSRGEKFSKVRPLKPCLDLNHEVYYRSKRDKYIPLEVFNHTFNPFPNVHHPRRYCYPEAPKPSVQTIPWVGRGFSVVCIVGLSGISGFSKHPSLKSQFRLAVFNAWDGRLPLIY